LELVSISHSLRNDPTNPILANRLVASERPTSRISGIEVQIRAQY